MHTVSLYGHTYVRTFVHMYIPTLNVCMCVVSCTYVCSFLSCVLCVCQFMRLCSVAPSPLCAQSCFKDSTANTERHNKGFCRESEFHCPYVWVCVQAWCVHMEVVIRPFYEEIMHVCTCSCEHVRVIEIITSLYVEIERVVLHWLPSLPLLPFFPLPFFPSSPFLLSLFPFPSFPLPLSFFPLLCFSHRRWPLAMFSKSTPHLPPSSQSSSCPFTVLWVNGKHTTHLCVFTLHVHVYIYLECKT